MLFLRYFPGMTVKDVTDGTNGSGMPQDWWTTGCALIDTWLKRGV